MRFSARLSVLIISVLARPGTPSSRQCPRLKSEISSSSITSLWPTMTWRQLVDDLLRGAARQAVSMAAVCGCLSRDRSWDILGSVVVDARGMRRRCSSHGVADIRGLTAGKWARCRWAFAG